MLLVGLSSVDCFQEWTLEAVYITRELLDHTITNCGGDRFFRLIPCGFWEALSQRYPIVAFVSSDSDGKEEVVDYFTVHPVLGGSAK